MEDAFSWYGAPEIFYTDQGSQFTSALLTEILKDAGAKISMNGKGRSMENIFIMLLWPSVKCECVYLREYEIGTQARDELDAWFNFYNWKRPHSGFDGKRPMEVYCGHRPSSGGQAPHCLKNLEAA